MKNVLSALALLALAAVSAPAQGLINWGNINSTRISTNAVIGGTPTGLIAGTGNYRFALFYSPIATSVNGQTAGITGGANANYAFNDSSWQLVAYGTNTVTAGRFTPASPTVVPGVAGGTTAQFVVIGWSANIGTSIAAVQAWFSSGQAAPGMIGQSAVSGAIYLGDDGVIPTPTLFGNASGLVPGFTLGYGQDSLTYWAAYIYEQPTNLTASVGSLVNFSVLASGSPTPNYQWNFNGTNIAGATNATLTILNVQLTNAGNYSVSVSNFLGGAISSNALLTVLSSGGTAPIIVTQPTSASVGQSSNTTFTVVVSGSSPLNYQWSFNGTNLLNATNATLTLNNVQPTNAGNYSVTITNLYGTTNSTPAALTVLTFPPTITAQPQNYSVLAGSPVTFTVAATGSAALHYQWFFNGNNLPGETNAIYTIANIQTNNAGSYVVTISSIYGTTNSASATLTIVPPSGYVFFANNNNSATKIFTNSVVGGPVTGLTGTNAGLYYYALYVSATATSVNGRTAAILGNADNSYAFYDNNWTLAAYGKNVAIRGRLASSSTDIYGQTPVVGFAGGTWVQFVVIGWSANIGTNIAAVQAWFNGGWPVSDGWIGQSAVSGSIGLGDGGVIPSPTVFAVSPPALQGFTLGLASPSPAASYPPPNIPPPVLTTTKTGGFLKLSWPAFYSSYGVQSASSPVGPWSDSTATPVTDGTNWSVTIPIASQQPFYRLIVK